MAPAFYFLFSRRQRGRCHNPRGLPADPRGMIPALLRSVAESKSVFERQFNQAFVPMPYFGHLRRDPDAAPDADFSGFQFWLDKLNEFDGSYIEAEMVRAFITSLEYQQRFGRANFDLSQ